MFNADCGCPSGGVTKSRVRKFALQIRRLVFESRDFLFIAKVSPIRFPPGSLDRHQKKKKKKVIVHSHVSNFIGVYSSPSRWKRDSNHTHTHTQTCGIWMWSFPQEATHAGSLESKRDEAKVAASEHQGCVGQSGQQKQPQKEHFL